MLTQTPAGPAFAGMPRAEAPLSASLQTVGRKMRSSAQISTTAIPSSYRPSSLVHHMRGGEGEAAEPRRPPAHLELQSPIAYITDCRDENGKGRLKARLTGFFPGCSVQFVGVSTDYEAALNLVDIVDAYDGRPGIILANVARREGLERKSKWPNGPPFAWLQLGNIDIFTTVDGYVVSLLQRMLGRDLKLFVYDIPATVPHMGLSAERQAQVINTQFRSFDYLPLLAAQLLGYASLPVTSVISEIPNMPLALCWVDSFGNIKTNALPEDVGLHDGKMLSGSVVAVRIDDARPGGRSASVGFRNVLHLPFYNRLKDIPGDQVALTIGSSGLGSKRFLEILQQGASAASTLALQSGINIEFVPQA